MIGLKRGLEKYDEKPPTCVGGDKGLTKSINATVNLANAAHYDVNDECVGAAIWFEKNKEIQMDVYFIFPNIVVEDSKGISQNGLLVKIKDSCIISWDGNSLRHCTSIRTDPSNQDTLVKPDPSISDLFSFHFVNNAANLRLINEARQGYYQNILGEPAGEYNWEAFAWRQYYKESSFW